MASTVIGNLMVNIAGNSASLSTELRKAKGNSQRFGKGVMSVNQRVAKSFKFMANAASVAASSFGIAKFLKATDAMKNMESQLKLVTGSTEQLTRVQRELFAIADRTFAQVESTSTLYARLARSTDTLGLSEGELLRITEAVNNAFRISGATATESSAAIIQLSQGLAAGALRGEEFNSVAEQAPRLMKALSDSLGVGVGELRAMAKDGKLTADIVSGALLQSFDKLRSEADQIGITTSGAFTQMSNSALRLAGEFEKSGGVASGFVTILGGIKTALDFVREEGLVRLQGFFIRTFARITSTVEVAKLGLQGASKVIQHAWVLASETIYRAWLRVKGLFTDTDAAVQASLERSRASTEKTTAAIKRLGGEIARVKEINEGVIASSQQFQDAQIGANRMAAFRENSAAKAGNGLTPGSPPSATLLARRELNQGAAGLDASALDRLEKAVPEQIRRNISAGLISSKDARVQVDAALAEIKRLRSGLSDEASKSNAVARQAHAGALSAEKAHQKALGDARRSGLASKAQAAASGKTLGITTESQARILSAEKAHHTASEGALRASLAAKESAVATSLLKVASLQSAAAKSGDALSPPPVLRARRELNDKADSLDTSALDRLREVVPAQIHKKLSAGLVDPEAAKRQVDAAIEEIERLRSGLSGGAKKSLDAAAKAHNRALIGDKLHYQATGSALRSSVASKEQATANDKTFSITSQSQSRILSAERAHYTASEGALRASLTAKESAVAASLLKVAALQAAAIGGENNKTPAGSATTRKKSKSGGPAEDFGMLNDRGGIGRSFAFASKKGGKEDGVGIKVGGKDIKFGAGEKRSIGDFFNLTASLGSKKDRTTSENDLLAKLVDAMKTLVTKAESKTKPTLDQQLEVLREIAKKVDKQVARVG